MTRYDCCHDCTWFVQCITPVHLLLLSIRNMCVSLKGEDLDDENAALGRMLASHNQNMQSQSRPLDDEPDAPFPGTAAVECVGSRSAGISYVLL